MTYELGITRHVPHGITRRTILGSAAAMLAFARIAPGFAQTSTPESLAEGDADAVAALKLAGEAVLDLETFTFAMTTTNGSSTIFPGVELVSVEGVVRRPIDLAATLKVKAFVQTLEISAVAIDGDFFVQDPLSGGKWMSLGNGSEVANMVNPDWILLAAIRLIKDAKITDKSDESTLIEGYLNFSESLSQLGSGDMSQMEEFLASGPIDVAFWINADNLIERAELYGPIFASESSDVEKRIELSAFNEPVEIESPNI